MANEMKLGRRSCKESAPDIVSSVDIKDKAATNGTFVATTFVSWTLIRTIQFRRGQDQDRIRKFGCLVPGSNVNPMWQSLWNDLAFRIAVVPQNERWEEGMLLPKARTGAVTTFGLSARTKWASDGRDSLSFRI
jgi:hypothetical protein